MGMGMGTAGMARNRLPGEQDGGREAESQGGIEGGRESEREGWREGWRDGEMDGKDRGLEKGLHSQAEVKREAHEISEPTLCETRVTACGLK